MSPTKKKSRKAPSKKVAKKATAKKVAKKTTAKKVAKKTKATAKKVAKKTTAKKTVRKTTAKKTTTKKTAAAPKGKPPAAKKKAAASRQATAKSVPKGKPIPLSEIPHPKYGFKFECFSCSTRFYLMGRTQPTCPKCGADQRERPKETAKPAAKPKRPAVRPMAPLLDDDEEVRTVEVNRGTPREPREPDAMFDDAEVASVSEDADEAPRRKTAADEDDDS